MEIPHGSGSHEQASADAARDADADARLDTVSGEVGDWFDDLEHEGAGRVVRFHAHFCEGGEVIDRLAAIVYEGADLNEIENPTADFQSAVLDRVQECCRQVARGERTSDPEGVEPIWLACHVWIASI